MGWYRTPTVMAAASLLLTALCAGQAPAAAPPARVGIDDVIAEKLDDAITAAMREAGIPGVGVGLWIDGDEAYVRSFGTADKTTGIPIKTDMHTRIGSVTKTFTVTGVLQLVDDGKVRLDAPISTYLDGVPGGDRITVRQLAEMRSGLYNYTEDPRWTAAFKADPYRAWTPQQLLDIAFRHPADFPPGARWEYSNTNTILLGLLVEKVSGQPLHTYLEQHVLAPAGLDATSLPTGAEITSPYVHGYTDFTPDGATVDASQWNPSWGWAAGAMISTIDDLHGWVPTLVGGGLPDGNRLLEPGTQAQRLRMLPTGHPDVGYGLGIAAIKGWIGHNGELPGYETIAVRHPQNRATLVIIVNSDIDGKYGSLSSLIANRITNIVTPKHVWSLPEAAQPNPIPNPSTPSTPPASPKP
ncbi:serine hydrolase domain-containing protein [Streptomyces sp. NRRL F-4428]|uniref:serine hydrolase domain-containing protein n=1 Tax=Streptomyces sp. NRRL F-4428 TaxID=1609137 RepID=UPI0005EC621F|nr:serine hydrolase domain-containing protein [Streptomyces sp. NRRL F-4428]KJK45998.1 beta-lactamase [Streptomyces sp. NRRL F-4428]